MHSPSPSLPAGADRPSFAQLRARMRGAAPGERHGVLAFGDPRVDRRLAGGGLALGQLHEVTTQGLACETGAVLAGFVACLLARLLAGDAGQGGAGRDEPGRDEAGRDKPGRDEAGRDEGGRPVFWIAATADLHPPGLLAYGLDPGRVIQVHTQREADTLEAMEACLRGGAAAAVVGEVGRLGRTPSRRLQLACQRRGTIGFALRRWPWGRAAGGETAREASAASTRWRVLATPSAADGRVPGLARWEVALTHARGGGEGAWIMELADEGATDAAFPLRVVAELADAAAASAGRPGIGHPGVRRPGGERPGGQRPRERGIAAA